MKRSIVSGLGGWIFRFACLSVTVMLVIAKTNTKGPKTPTDKNGVMQLRHGAFKCLGALISPQDILTCCTCVSEIQFDSDCPSEDEPVGYQMRALDPQNISIRTSDHIKTKGSRVTIHPQCDVDGTYDYAIVRIGKKAGENAMHLDDDGGEFWNFEKTIGRPKMYSTNPQITSKKICQRDGICLLHTIFEDDPENRVVKIATIFTDWHFCWNGSETKKSFSSKYCVRSCDEKPISEAKSGSPVYCEGKLVGILARRYALGGRAYGAVNGLDGAIDFIKETINVDMQPQEENAADLSSDLRNLGKKSKRYKKHNSRIKNKIKNI